jgi:hypothetical protein
MIIVCSLVRALAYQGWYGAMLELCLAEESKVKSKAVPLHAMEALGGRGGIAPTHSRPRH